MGVQDGAELVEEAHGDGLGADEEGAVDGRERLEDWIDPLAAVVANVQYP